MQHRHLPKLTPSPAVTVWAALLVSAAAANTWLIRTGRSSLSECAGRSVPRRVVAATVSTYFAFHFGRVGPAWLDPLSYVATRIRKEMSCPDTPS